MFLESNEVNRLKKLLLKFGMFVLSTKAIFTKDIRLLIYLSCWARICTWSSLCCWPPCSCYNIWWNTFTSCNKNVTYSNYHTYSHHVGNFLLGVLLFAIDFWFFVYLTLFDLLDVKDLVDVAKWASINSILSMQDFKQTSWWKSLFISSKIWVSFQVR